MRMPRKHMQACARPCELPIADRKNERFMGHGRPYVQHTRGGALRALHCPLPHGDCREVGGKVRFSTGEHCLPEMRGRGEQGARGADGQGPSIHDAAVPAHPDRHARGDPGLGPPLPTSAPGLGSPLPHLHRDWARPCHICTGTGLASATSAWGLGSPLQRLHCAGPCHICTGTGLDRAAKPHSRHRAFVDRPHFHWRKDASMPPCEHSIPAFF